VSEATPRLSEVRELTGGYGVHSVLECVGLEQAMNTAISIARPGLARWGRVGVPQEQTISGDRSQRFYNNVTVGGGPAPVRAYIAETLAGRSCGQYRTRSRVSIELSVLTAFRTVTGR